MSLAAWYHAQYANSPLSRTARARMVPFVPDRNNPIQVQLTRLGSAHRPPTPMPPPEAGQGAHQQTRGQGQGDVEEMFPGANQAREQVAELARRKEEERREKTLFGPGVGSGGVEERRKWGVGGEEREEVDRDVVKHWVERSSETSTPTTTLQALTNLKRPSIRLSPLHPHGDSTTPDPLAPHILEFAYDADCPLVSISIRVLPPTNQATEGDAAAAGLKQEGEEVFLTIAKGGFGQHLGAESNAVIELGRYEAHAAAGPTTPPLPGRGQSSPNGSPSATSPAGSQLALANRVDPSLSIPPSASPAPAPGTPGTGTNRRRFSFLPTRHRMSTTHLMPPGAGGRLRGPAVPVVDNTAHQPRPDPVISPALAAQLGFQVVDREEQEREKQRELERLEEERSGVRIGVWLEALDANGKKLPTRNAQATVLHVHRVGPKPGLPPAGGAPAAPTEGELESGTQQPRLSVTVDGHVVDTRPWLVRVVHREAIIGKHTFTLHEIYGLASGSSEPPAPPPPSAHSYPPTPAGQQQADTASTAPECILCLSSPRSVVLMPCRHLVACKECALNMLEFGAGGTIHQPTDDAPDAAGTGAEGGAAAPGAGDGAAGGIAGLATGRTHERRRKRKAKGWFCPICRQAYTSMLRISSNAPAGEVMAEIEPGQKDVDSSSAEGEHDHEHGDRPAAQRASTSTVPAGWKAHDERSPTPKSALESPTEETPANGEAPPAELNLNTLAYAPERPATSSETQDEQGGEEEFATAPATPTRATPAPAEPVCELQEVRL